MIFQFFIFQNYRILIQLLIEGLVFYTPSFSDSKNLGTGFEIPYYWAINKDKDFTLKNKLFATENPLFSGEYRQVFESSNLIFDFGYTKGYKQTSDTKKSGDKSHYFAKFVKNFSSKDNSESNLEVTFQEVSNDKYLRNLQNRFVSS